jgi:hypothetical protein
VTPSASLNARHGFAREQLKAVLAVTPYDATNVRCTAIALAAAVRAMRTANH